MNLTIYEKVAILEQERANILLSDKWDNLKYDDIPLYHLIGEILGIDFEELYYSKEHRSNSRLICRYLIKDEGEFWWSIGDALVWAIQDLCEDKISKFEHMCPTDLPILEEALLDEWNKYRSLCIKFCPPPIPQEALK